MKHSTTWLFWLLALAGAALLGWLIDGYSWLGAVVGLGAVGSLWLFLAMLQRPQLGLWLILFFLPFERIPSVEVGPITLRVNFLFGILAMLAVAALWAAGKLRTRPNPLAIPVLVFLIAGAASVVGAVESDRALFVLGFILFTALFGLLAIQLLQTKDQLRTALAVVWVSAVVVGVFGIYQFLGDAAGLPTRLTGLDEGYVKEVLGFPRVQAFSVEPLYLGNYLLLPLSLLLSALLLRVPKLPRLALWLLFGLLALILLLTVARGAYLAAAASLLVIIASLPRELLRPNHVIAGLLLLATVAIGTGWFVAQGRDDAIEQFQEHVTIGDLEEGESTQGRLMAFRQASEAWEDHPWIGIGLGNFGSYVKGYPDPRSLESFDIVNNEYLELLAETGLLGFGALAVAVTILLVRSALAFTASRDPLVRAGIVGTTAAFVGLLVQYNFFSTLYIIYVWVLVGLMVASQNLALVPTKTSGDSS